MNPIIDKQVVKSLRGTLKMFHLHRESFKPVLVTTTIILAACATTPSPDTGVSNQSKASSTSPSEQIVSLYISSKKGVEDFRTMYWVAEKNKAFASSDDGHYGWSSRMAMKEYAEQTAMKRCEEHLNRGDKKCRIVNINGIWVPHTVIPVSPVSPVSP